jgi:large subunit ribosomal protein L9
VPQGKAVPATAANVSMFEAKRAEFQAKADAVLAERRSAWKASRARKSPSRQCLDRRQAVRLGGRARHRRCLHRRRPQAGKVGSDPGEGAFRRTGEFEVTVHLHADVETK